MEQPKDYDELPFEAFLKDEYSYLSVPQKIIYQMQDHVVKITLISLALGYLAGMSFGKLW